MNAARLPARGSAPVPARLVRWRGSAAAVFAAALLATLTGAPPASASAPAATTECLHVEVVTDSWSTGPDAGGFLLNLTITNACASASPQWQLGLTLAAGHLMTDGWNAIWSGAGSQLLATGQAWNEVLAAGDSTTVGLLGSWHGQFQVPVSCTINGALCAPAPEPGDPPQVALTSPADGEGIMPPCRISLAADATVAGGAIDRVEFYINEVLVGTGTEAPYQLEITASHPAIRVVELNTVVARAYGSTGLADSAPVGFWISPMPPTLMVVACPSTLAVPAGGSASMTFFTACEQWPTVSLSVAGDPGITVTPSTFTPELGGQRVMVDAAAAVTGAVATITAVADEPNCMAARVPVAVVDGH